MAIAFFCNTLISAYFYKIGHNFEPCIAHSFLSKIFQDKSPIHLLKTTGFFKSGYYFLAGLLHL